jgi:hypothetical protein
MRMVPACMRLVAGLALAVLPTALPAAPAPGEPQGKTTSPAQKLRKDLDRVISVDIDQQPLHLAVNQLHEQTKINFVLDRLTLQQNGIDPEGLVVSLKLKNVKLRSALRALLTPYNLNFAILGDTVLISNDEMATVRQMRQRVNIDFDKVELNRALRQLARETATNLIVDTRAAREAQTPVTLEADDVPLETAVRLMAEMANLKPVRVGNTLFITSKTTANELRSDPDLAPMPQPGAPGGIAIMAGPGGVGAPAVVPPAPKTEEKPAEDKPEKPDPEEKKSDKKEEKSDRPADPKSPDEQSEKLRKPDAPKGDK